VARYQLHESVRLYARGQLAASAHADAAHAAHARLMLDHLGALATRPLAKRIASPAHLADADRALAWASVHDPVLAMQLCKACSNSWRRLGWHELAWHHARPLLALPVTPDDRLPRVDLMLGLCGIEFERDRLAESEALARGALALLATGETDHMRLGLAQSWLANVAAMRGQWPEAEAGYRAGLVAAQQAGDWRAQQDACNNLGWVLQAAGRPDEARPLLHQALALPHDDDWARMVSHENLGELEAGVGRSQPAMYHLESVVVLARRLPDAYRLANAQALMALACSDEQLAGPVPPWLRECLETARRQGYARLLAYACVGLARHRLAAGLPAEALVLLHAAQAVLARAGLEAIPLMTRSAAVLRQRTEAALGPDAPAAARARGELLSIDEIVALAG
jgi:tetratricopeptide (TPR) repeat protein